MTLKSKRFHVYCNDSEFEQLNKKAELHNLSISRYLVECGLSDNIKLSPYILKNVEQIRRETTLLRHHVGELLNKKSYLEQLLVSGELHNFIFFLTASAKYLHHIFLSNEKSNQSNQDNQNDKPQTHNSDHNPRDERENNHINNFSNGNSDNSKSSDSAATLLQSWLLAFSPDTNILLQLPTTINHFSFSHSEAYKENLTFDDQQNPTINNGSLFNSNSYCPSLDLKQIVSKNQNSVNQESYVDEIKQTLLAENQNIEIKDGEIKTLILDKNNSTNSLILKQQLADEHNTNPDDKKLTSNLGGSDNNLLVFVGAANDALKENLMDCFSPTSFCLELGNLNQSNMASPTSILTSGDDSSSSNVINGNDNYNNELSNLSDTQEDDAYEGYELSDEEYFAYINESEEDFNARWEKIHQLVRHLPPISLDSSPSNPNINPSSNSSNTSTNLESENLDSSHNLENLDELENTQQKDSCSSHNFNPINQDNISPSNDEDFP